MLNIKKIIIWTAEMDDQPGSTTGLFKMLADAGADLSFVVARRQMDSPGKAVIFVSPISGAKQEAAARQGHFTKRSDVVGVQVQGPNKKGLGFQMTQALGNANLNLRAISSHVIGKTFSAVFAFDSDEDATRGVAALKKVKA